jgi:hypothetical protein
LPKSFRIFAPQTGGYFAIRLIKLSPMGIERVG